MTATQTAKSGNPYLEGFLAPVTAELTATDLQVTGHIPEHLNGRYLRNGPNPARRGRPRDLSLVHRRRHGARRRAARREGPLVPQPLGAQPGRMRRSGRAAPGRAQPTGRHAGPGRQHQCVDATPAGPWRSSKVGIANYELTDELDTVGTCDFDGTLSGGYTAHPHRDPHDRRTARAVLLVRARTDGAVLGDRHRRAAPAAPSTSRCRVADDA